MRLIDAGALKDEWEEPKDWMDREQVLRHITWFRAVIDEQPTIDPVKWTSVSERLPEKNSEYLVTKIDHITHERLIDIAYYGSFIHENNGFHKADDIVAWMPLPEPWKGEEDETD